MDTVYDVPIRRYKAAPKGYEHMDTNSIGHAIAYCEIMLSSRNDPAEMPEFRTIQEYKRILTIDNIVRIIRETVDHKPMNVIESRQIKDEMSRKDFRTYIERKLGV